MASASELFDVAKAGTDRKQLVVEMSLTAEERLDVQFCNNMMVRSIGPKSKALYALILGDQIIDINGKVPNNPAEAIQIIRSSPQVRFCVSRVTNRTPVSIDRAKSLSLRRHDGYGYFVVTLYRSPAVPHLGLGIKSFRGKVTVHRVDRNSIAASVYMVGDNILDINGERATDTDFLKKRLVDLLSNRGFCSTVVERPASAGALQNTQATMYLLVPRTVEPQMADDVVAIGQREMLRHRANALKKRNIRPILKKEPANAVSTPPDRAVQEQEPDSFSMVRNIFFSDGSPSDPRTTKRKKQHHVTFSKNTESTIESDVQNPNLLQKVRRPGQLRSLGITMLPAMFFNMSSKSAQNPPAANAPPKKTSPHGTPTPQHP